MTNQPDEPIGALAAPARPAPRARRFALRRSSTRLLVELVVVTAGVLIALLIDSLVEWNRFRVLVDEAHRMIAREMADNQREIETVLRSMGERERRIGNALGLANDLLVHQKTTINELQLNLEFADITSASWSTAAQTGALAHMEYADVQRYARLYDLQELFVQQQHRSLELLSSAIAVFAAGELPDKVPEEDLKVFRQHLLALQAQSTVEKQLAMRLAENYTRMLQEPR